MKDTTVFVTGATGNQGGAVTDALLEAGANVRALVRDPAKPKAQALAARGVELVVGDLNDGTSVRAAAQGSDVAFVVTTPFAPGVGMDGEIRQGRIVIDAIKAAEVPHLVYSSISDANRETGIPHFDTKLDAEKHLASSGLKYTITGPVYFSDNVALPWNVPDLKSGRFRQAMPGDRMLQVVSVRDIGRFNAAVIARHAELVGRRIDYAADELTPAQMAEALSKAMGRPIAYEAQSLEEVASIEEMAKMFEWFDRVGYTADIAALRREFPEVGWQRFGDWAESQDWAALLG